MDFLSIAELNTHLYEEISDEITREEDSIVQEAIDTAIDEVKGYIAKYDLDTIFEPDALEDRNKKLLSVTKDIAVWHVIILGNPNIEIAIREKRYIAAVDWLKGVQKGAIDPLFPMPTTIPVTGNGSDEGAIKWRANDKRNNHF